MVEPMVEINNSEINLIYLSINAKNTPTFNQIPELDQVFHKFMEIIFLEKIDDEQE
jgi:hypothetical protein